MAIEAVGRFAECHRERPQQYPGQREYRVVPGGHRFPEAVEVGPLIGAQQRVAGHIAGVVGGKLDGQVEGLLGVHRARREDLLTRRHIAAMVGGVGDVHAMLLRIGKCEERRGGGQQVSEKCVIDTVPDDLGETDTAGGVAECLDRAVVTRIGLVEQTRHVQHRDIGESGGHHQS